MSLFGGQAEFYLPKEINRIVTLMYFGMFDGI